jgi:hypothetical protein
MFLTVSLVGSTVLVFDFATSGEPYSRNVDIAVADNHPIFVPDAPNTLNVERSFSNFLCTATIALDGSALTERKPFQSSSTTLRPQRLPN